MVRKHEQWGTYISVATQYDLHKNCSLCSVCNKEFTRPQVLKEHVLTIHEGKKKPCSICNREFSTSKSLKWHILSVHEGKTGPHTCSICGKNCSSPSELKWHISGVHEKNKPFECSFCNIRFALRTTLTQHVQNRHTEKTPHPCPNCGKVYMAVKIWPKTDLWFVLSSWLKNTYQIDLILSKS